MGRVVAERDVRRRGGLQGKPPSPGVSTATPKLRHNARTIAGIRATARMFFDST
jgi:hypothetical protein